MSLPQEITTRRINFGPAFAMLSGKGLVMRLAFTPTRSMVWLPTGTPVMALTEVYKSDSGMEEEVPFPVTDIAEGWGDGEGNAITLEPSGHTHAYRLEADYLLEDGSPSGLPSVKKIFALPTDDLSPVDLDTLIPVSTAGGMTVSIPDTWDAKISAAEKAAEAIAALIPPSDTASPGDVVTFDGESALWAPMPDSLVEAVDSSGDPMPGYRARVVFDVNGDPDDIVLEEV